MDMVIFQNREQAAEVLAKRLIKYRGQNPLVLGIPRGALPMASIIADRLEGDLDVVLVHKVSAPRNREYALGSVTEYGDIYWRNTADIRDIPESELKKAAQEEIKSLRQRRETLAASRVAINPKDRTVIVVDDGIATGATVMAALRAIRAQNPKKLIIAAPVAAPNSLLELRPMVDEMTIIEAPEWFFSIGEFYESFEQVTDQDVVRILQTWRERKARKESNEKQSTYAATGTA